MNIQIKYLLTILILSVSVIIGQNQITPTNKNIGNDNSFFQDIINYKSDKDGQTKVEVFVQVPYHTILFVKSDNVFHGKYSVTVSFLDEKGKDLFAEKIWNEKLNVKDFKTTSSKKISNISHRTFFLQPGQYLVRTSIEDKETKKEFVKTMKFKVSNFSDDVTLSGIMFIKNIDKKNGNKKVVPNISKNVAKQKDGVPIYYEIYSNKKMDIVADYSIMDKEEESIFNDTVPVKIDSGLNNIFYTAKDTTINLGKYKFNIVIKNNDGDEITETKKTFFSKWAGAPSNILDLETAIEQLEYIATEEQIEYINDAKIKEEKIRRYKEFWKSKDPNPLDDENQMFNEYYRRINISNAEFTYYSRPGWKTDRGMVFIVLGQPNDIKNHPYNSYSKPYVIWEYYELNRSFTFVDVTGFGDYRLANPLDFAYFRYQ